VTGVAVVPGLAEDVPGGAEVPVDGGIVPVVAATDDGVITVYSYRFMRYF